MSHRKEITPEVVSEEIFVAGQKVAPGKYHLVGSRRTIRLDSEDILPATCDGHVATYVREPLTWAEMVREATRTLVAA